jgi:hypothetical protein
MRFWIYYRDFTFYSIPAINYNDISVALGSGTQTFYLFSYSNSRLLQCYCFYNTNCSIRLGFTYTNKELFIKTFRNKPNLWTLDFTADANVTITNVSQAGVVSN